MAVAPGGGSGAGGLSVEHSLLWVAESHAHREPALQTRGVSQENHHASPQRSGHTGGGREGARGAHVRQMVFLDSVFTSHSQASKNVQNMLIIIQAATSSTHGSRMCFVPLLRINGEDA